MGALARGLIHKRAFLTSVTGRLDQSGAGAEDAGRAGGVGVYGVISFRKMRHLCRPSHCGSFLLSFLVNNNHQQTPHSGLHTHFLNSTQGPG